MAMNYTEYEEMKRNGFSNVVKWGQYTDTRYTTPQEEEAPALSADEMTEQEGGFEAAANSFDEVAPEFMEEDPGLSEAEAIAARVEAQAKSRIQDDVSKLIAGMGIEGQ